MTARWGAGTPSGGAGQGVQGRRLVALDLARTVALVGMAVFHLVFDLVLFGHLPGDILQAGFWPQFARVVAGSFLFLAGVSLWLAQGHGIRWPAFARRFAVVAGAAAAISVATRIAMPDTWIFFGILHAIAVASLIGLAVLRLPVAAVLALAGAVVAMRVWGQSDLFNHPALLWTGLGTGPAMSVDFVPVFPWLAPFLGGIAMARLADAAGLWRRIAGWPSGRLWSRLAWPGRHSLIVYLVHQPVLISVVYAVTWALRA
ncbi:MAG: heparan-alpha-glucosaminide N-acetyltransferase [Gemmobacter sp.]